MIDISDIRISKRLRELDNDKVEALMKSIDEVGIINPISVNRDVLIAGAHRLEACRRLGMTAIPTRPVGDVTDKDLLSLIEIDENLFRNELSPAEKDQHVAERLEILKRRTVKDSVQSGGRNFGDLPKNGPTKEEARAQKKIETAAGKEAASEVAEQMGMHPSDVSRAKSNHKAVTKAGLDQGKLNELNQQDYRLVAKIAKTDSEEAARTLDKLIDTPKEKPITASYTGDNEWYTPPDEIKLIRKFLGDIDLDPTSNDFAQQHIKAKKYYTIDDSGLDEPWYGRVFMNPPYAKAKKDGTPGCQTFINKLIEEYDSGNVTEAIVLVNSQTSSDWYQDAGLTASLMCHADTRVKFCKNVNGKLEVPRDKNGQVKTLPVGQTYFYFGERDEQFFDAFRDVGMVSRPMNFYAEEGNKLANEVIYRMATAAEDDGTPENIALYGLYASDRPSLKEIGHARSKYHPDKGGTSELSLISNCLYKTMKEISENQI